jgi:hypothetical protein
MFFEFGEYMYEMIMNLSTLDKILAFIGFSLLTFAVVVTILDYRNKGKHINRKGW